MSYQCEVFVYGATPGGIGAAIAAARKGRRVVLAEPTGHIGGLMTSGLGRTDIDWPEASGAIYREFLQKVLADYTARYGPDSQQVKDCRGGMFFEPSVAEKLFAGMVEAEKQNLTVLTGHLLKQAVTEQNRLVAVELAASNGEISRWSAGAFIDATYEGDLAAAAGVPYLTGRESRDDWNEEYAGKLYMNFDGTKRVFPGSTGEGDHRIQAYNYRLCLTDVPENRIACYKPEVYRREDYTSLIGDVEAGRVKSIRDVLNILPVPNGKTDANNHHYCMCSSDLPEENQEYLDGDEAVRRRIRTRQRHYLEGLLWFLQHDEALPETFRQDALRFGYAADEFAESGHFPPQLYVREGRRICGEYMFTENDARLAPGLGRTPVHGDSVVVGSYAIDSHATRKREPAGENVALEGFLGLGWITEIYQVPYGVMVPQQVDGLLVPVAVSATHMGLGTIRMEPCWMQLGFAAGVAADMSLTLGTPERKLPIDLLQDRLLEEGQMITFFRDANPLTEEGTALQYWGAKGVFDSYEAEPDRPVSVAFASRLLALARLLPGGRSLPALPASANVLPAGVDMGPRLPKTEPSPAEYWQAHPLLPRPMLARWVETLNSRLAAGISLSADAGRSSTVSVDAADGEIVRVGEFCRIVYQYLKKNRS
ncbi:FAD-dependent oxidoreductase [Paenibacillus sp. YN15]|uniref:FAD-dependent oxidoreductase n=1 Tax=Paenibacillus sp. YN15 TaxID=1742774 RepID=UPI000DCD2A57|nr:FAD-dependent oxidoreductase [Paenibacillus sp. YN15]RAV04152.1 FAD-dependent oxidoreductase [Paenibacillus sp. YN15]